MHETEQTVTGIPEISPEREATYENKNVEGTYYLFCGDDRELTEESANALRLEGVEDPDNALRTFGAGAGTARTIATALCANGGSGALESYRGKYMQFIKDSGERLKAAANLIPGTHSGEANEEHSSVLNHDSENGIGCAYAANAQLVTQLNYSDDILQLATREIEQLSGKKPEKIEAIALASKEVEAIFSSDGQQTFNLDRDDLRDLDIPTAIVKGSHAKAADTAVILNFHTDKVSNPRKAKEQGIPAYDIDITQECEAILKANPDLNLDPRTLVETKIVDICATRKALAGSEGKEAADLHIERYGDYETAVSYLESVKAAHSNLIAVRATSNV